MTDKQIRRYRQGQNPKKLTVDGSCNLGSLELLNDPNPWRGCVTAGKMKGSNRQKSCEKPHDVSTKMMDKNMKDEPARICVWSSRFVESIDYILNIESCPMAKELFSIRFSIPVPLLPLNTSSCRPHGLCKSKK
jgi:hypothetical protein